MTCAGKSEPAPRQTAPVSVVIPCYRCSGTIGRAVESVARQSVLPREVILVDDCGGDETLQRLFEVQSAYGGGWIKVVRLNANLGAGEARNAGWDAAREEYVAFLDADDSWHPQKIEVQYQFMRDHPDIAASGHGHRRISRNNGHCPASLKTTFRPIDKSSLILSNRFITPSVMLKRDLPLRFAAGKRFMEDHHLWLKLIFSGYNMVRLDAELAYIYKDPFGESGLSANIVSMEKGELDNYWSLYRDRAVGLATTLGLTVFSLLKFLRRIVLSSMTGNRMPLLFPFVYMVLSQSMTALLIMLGLAGKPEISADIALVHGATVATFYAFSANTRNLILGRSAAVSVSELLLSRIVLIVPLGALSLGLAVFGAGVSMSLAGVLVARRCVEWINEVHLCEAELEHERRFALLFLVLQALLLLAALVMLLTGSAVAIWGLWAWALLPGMASIGFCLGRTSSLSLRRLPSLLPRLAPHFGSTAIIGVSLFVFRLIVSLLADKIAAGELFTAIAIGSFLGTVFANVLGPSIALHEDRSGRAYFPFSLRIASIAAGVSGAVIVVSEQAIRWVSSLTGKSSFFVSAAGLSLIGGALMISAQRIRVRLLRTDKAVGVFGPDLMAHILLVASVPVLYFVGGQDSLASLYLVNAALIFVFYKSSEMDSLEWQKKTRFGIPTAWLQFAIVFALFFPLFFQLSGEIYNSAEPVVDSAGVLKQLPLPVSVLACYAGIFLLGGYRHAARSLGVVFMMFVALLLSSVATTSGQLLEERGKLLLLLQFMLPTFALVLGDLLEGSRPKPYVLERGILAVLAIIIPLQLAASWAAQSVTLSHSVGLFAVYQHYQYVPVILGCGYLIVLSALWDKAEYRSALWGLGLLTAIYVAATFSFLALATVLGGLLAVGLYDKRRARDRSMLVLFVASFLGALGYLYLARDSAEFSEKYESGHRYPEYIAGKDHRQLEYVAKIAKLRDEGVWEVNGAPHLRFGYLLAFTPYFATDSSVFVVEGELLEGGLSIGVVSGQSWHTQRYVITPGPFSVEIRPGAGRFSAIVANYLPNANYNRARITRFAWERSSSTARPANGSEKEKTSSEEVHAADTPERPLAGTPATKQDVPATARVTSPELASETKVAAGFDWLPKNLRERVGDWVLFGRGVFASPKSFFFGHSRPMDRSIRSSAHNYYLDLLYNFGVVGLLPLVGLVAYTLRLVWVKRRLVVGSRSLLVLTAVVLFLLLVDSNFKVTLRQPYPGIIAFFLWGVLLSRLAVGGRSRPLKETP